MEDVPEDAHDPDRKMDDSSAADASHLTGINDEASVSYDVQDAVEALMMLRYGRQHAQYLVVHLRVDLDINELTLEIELVLEFHNYRTNRHNS